MNLFDKLNEELSYINEAENTALDNNDARADMQNNSKLTLNKLKTGITNAILKVKNWALKIFSETFKTLGFGIAKTRNNKFNLFNKDGNKIIPNDADRISASVDNQVVEVVQGDTITHLSKNKFIGKKQNLSKGYTAVYSYRLPQAIEPIPEEQYQKLNNILNEALPTSDLMQMAGEDSVTDKEFKKEVNKEFTSHVNYKQLMDVIDESLNLLDSAPSSLPQVIAIYGDSGIGKTQIIKALAQKQELNFFYMELGKVDRSLITGIPYLSNEYKDDSKSSSTQLKIAGAAGVFPSEGDKAIKEVLDKGKADGSVTVETKGTDRNWIVFFDEFNRARTDVTSVIMNLLLTGRITSSEKLVYDDKTKKLVNVAGKEGVIAEFPGKPIIFLGMNQASQMNLETAFQDIHALDIATVSRLVTTYKLKAEFNSWQENFAGIPGTEKFGSKGTEVILFPRVPQIITSYMNSLVDEAKEKGSKDAQGAPFNITKHAGDDAAAMDPRTWTHIGDKYYRNAYAEFKKLSKKEKEALGLHDKALRMLHSLNSIVPSTESEGDATLMSGSSFKKVSDISSKLSKMEADKAAKELEFSVYANTNWARMAKFLNTQDIAASFGTGMEDDKNNSAADIVKKLHTDMVDHIVKQRNKYIDPKTMFLGYFDIKDKPASSNAKKVRDAYFTNTGTKEKPEFSPKFDTYEFADSFGLFLSALGVGQEKQNEVINGNSLNGNIKIAIDILDSMGVNANTGEGSKYILGEKAKKYKGIISSSSGAQKGEAIIKMAIGQILDNLELIFKDFSSASNDVMSSVNEVLNRYKAPAFPNNTKNIVFDEPFAKLLQLFLQNDDRFRNASSEKTSSGSRKAAYESKNVFRSMLNELKD